MKKSNLVEAKIISSSTHRNYMLKGLTWQGHEFLAVARKDTLWERAKGQVLEKTGYLSIDLLKTVLLGLGKRALE